VAVPVWCRAVRLVISAGTTSQWGLLGVKVSGVSRSFASRVVGALSQLLHEHVRVCHDGVAG